MDDARFWKRAATRTARQLNLGTWLEKTLPVWALVSALAACALLFFRKQGGLDTSLFWIVTASTFVAAGAAVFLMHTRRHLTTAGDALVWLEHRLALRNRLSAADAGVGAWPSERPEALELLDWRASRIVPAPLFSIALLAAAWWVPVALAPARTPPPMAPPVAWTEMERWLAEVEDTELVDERGIDAWEERLDSLEDQPKDEWYRHSSLEASDALREELASELRALERGLSEAEGSLTDMLELDENASAERRGLSQERLSKALEDLDAASLPLSREVKRQLMTLARERNIKKMTKEELEKLRERLRERRYADLPRPGDEAYAFLNPGGSSPAGGNRPGKGGVNRGPGSAPLELADERTELDTSRVEDVMGREPLGTEFGETLGVGVGEHDIDTSAFRFGEDGGAVVAPGDGGELVWSQTLTPAERLVLKKYFK